MKITGLILVLVVAFILTAGCDEKGGGASIALPVSADTPASDMNEEERLELCISAATASRKAVVAKLTALAEDACEESGFNAAAEESTRKDATDEDVIDACKDSVSFCEEATDEDFDEKDFPTVEEYCEDDAESLFESCDAEVGDIAECLEGAFDLLSDSIEKIQVPSCSDLSVDYFNTDNTEEEDEDNDDDDDNDDESPELPDVCDHVFDECPKLEVLAGDYK